jgi:hypothetical protein
MRGDREKEKKSEREEECATGGKREKGIEYR